MSLAATLPLNLYLKPTYQRPWLLLALPPVPAFLPHSMPLSLLVCLPKIPLSHNHIRTCRSISSASENASCSGTPSGTISSSLSFDTTIKMST